MYALHEIERTRGDHLGKSLLSVEVRACPGIQNNDLLRAPHSQCEATFSFPSLLPVVAREILGSIQLTRVRRTTILPSLQGEICDHEFLA
jgi:hypothetical protein